MRKTGKSPGGAELTKKRNKHLKTFWTASSPENCQKLSIKALAKNLGDFTWEKSQVPTPFFVFFICFYSESFFLLNVQ
jgi:hypothetical protein